MVRTFSIIAAISLASVPAQPSMAQSLVATPNAASAALGKCMVLKTTGADRILFARWLASSMATAPAMEGVISVDATKKGQIDREMGALFTRLFAQDCPAEAKVLIGARDEMGLKAAGGMIGEIAMQELMSDPTAMKSLMAYLQYIDNRKLEVLAK